MLWNGGDFSILTLIYSNFVQAPGAEESEPVERLRGYLHDEVMLKINDIKVAREEGTV